MLLNCSRLKTGPAALAAVCWGLLLLTQGMAGRRLRCSRGLPGGLGGRDCWDSCPFSALWDAFRVIRLPAAVLIRNGGLTACSVATDVALSDPALRRALSFCPVDPALRKLPPLKERERAA